MALEKSTCSSISPKGQLMGSLMGDWEHTFTPSMIGWTMGSRVNGKLSARKVTHPNTILALLKTSSMEGVASTFLFYKCFYVWWSPPSMVMQAFRVGGNFS